MNLEKVKKNIRKHKDVLATCGYGVLVFLVWTLVKVIIFVGSIIPEITTNSQVLYSVSYLSIFLVNTTIGAICGFLALKEGKNNKTGNIVLRVLSVLLSLIAAFNLVVDVFTDVSDGTFSFVIIVTYIADVAFLIICLQIMISSFKLLKFYKLEEENSNER